MPVGDSPCWARWRLVGALAVAWLPVQGLLRPVDVGADDHEVARPLVTSGIPTADGWVFPHYGLSRPPEDGGAPWALRRVGTHLSGGRMLDVYRYARPADGAGGAFVFPSAFSEAELVDPLTGERVGGLARQALEASLDRAPEAASGTCAAGR